MESDLRAAVFASPDDDAPRMVYADWLAERGDPRGEFIQIQCQLGRAIGSKGPLSPNHKAAGPTAIDDRATIERLELRERALLRKHQKAWIAPIRSYVNSWFWRRGFVHRIDVNVEKLIKHAALLFDATPLEAVFLMGCTPVALRSLAKVTHLGSLRSLTCSAQRIGPRDAEIFCDARFANLRELVLDLNPLGDDAVAVLAGATILRELRELDLSFSEQKLTSRGLERLAAAEFFPRLTHLDLTCSLENKTAIGPLLARGTSLRSLELGDQKITKQEAATWAAWRDARARGSPS